MRALVDFVMIVGAVGLLTGVTVKALFRLEILGMELLLLPPVAINAPVLVLAAILVRGNEALGLPIGAALLRITKKLRFSSVILPVVCIDAKLSLVVALLVRTPYRFEMK